MLSATDMKTNILNQFSHGVSIEQMTAAAIRNENEHGNKITKKQARNIVEKIIYEDYLRNVKAAITSR